MFDFPTSPSEGQIFNAPSGPTYVFQNPVWRAIGQGQIAIISDTAPANPANGTLWWESDTGILFVYVNDGNSSQWVQAGGIAAGGAINVVTFLASGTYTPPAGLRYAEVQCWGAGGAGGGHAITGAGQKSVGSGGNGGAMASGVYSAAEIGASIAITIGSGGTGVAGANGNAGAATSFGALVVTFGGAGGRVGGVTTATAVTSVPVTASLSSVGQVRSWTPLGGFGVTGSITATGGQGGATMWGGEGIATYLASSGAGGQAAQANTGSGGGGAAAYENQGAGRAGGAGGSGIVVIKEYF